MGILWQQGDARIQVVAKDENGVMATCSFQADLEWHPLKISDVDRVGCEYKPAQLYEITIADRGIVLHLPATTVADLLAENKRLRDRLAISKASAPSWVPQATVTI